MTGTQSIQQRAAGLWLNYSRLGMPEGALLAADNTVIEEEGKISKRRGYSRYNSVAFSAAPLQILGEYKNKILTLDGTTIKYDNGSGTFASWSGSFAKPTDAVLIHWMEAVQNYYFTTSQGLYKNSSFSGTPIRSGTPQGLDIQLTQVGATGWLPNNNQVAYKVVWIKKDTNNNEAVSTPSYREVAVNTSGNPVDITLKTTIPSEMVVGDMYEIYRSYYAVSTDPGEDCLLLRRLSLSSIDINGQTVTITRVATTATVALASHGFSNGDFVTISGAAQTEYNGTFTISNVTAGTFDYTVSGTPVTPATGTINCKTTFIRFADVYDESFLEDLPLYTNTTEEGLAAGNFRPPLGVDCAYWKGYGWQANTQREQRKRLVLTSIAGITDNVDTFTIQGDVTTHIYTFSTAEAIESRKFQRFTGGTDAENIRNTIKSLAHIINNDPNNTELNAFVDTGVNAAPGVFWIESRTPSAGPLYFRSSIGSKFEDNLPVAGNTIYSDNENFQNRLYFSKLYKPEAVMLTQFFELGHQDTPIERILPLRDSLIVLKQEGIWRINGESEYSFSDQEIDLTCGILAPESAVRLGDRIYCMTNKGVVRIDESGVEVVSHPIENQLRPLTQYTNFRTLTHGTAYEGVNDNKYILWTQTGSTDTIATQGWVYNYLISVTPWTRWVKRVKHGYMSLTDRKLYLAHAADAHILKERKSFSLALDDFYDEEITISITGKGTTSSGKTYIDMTYTYTGYTPVAGFMLRYGVYESKITSVTLLATNSYRCVLADTLTLPATPFAASVYLPIRSKITFVESGRNVAITKQFLEAQIYNESDLALTNYISTYTNRDPSSETITYPVIQSSSAGWGLLPWGSGPWGGLTQTTATPMRILIPQQHRLGEELYIEYVHEVAKETFGLMSLAVIFKPTTTRTSRVR